jgi:hypothetical protein
MGIIEDRKQQRRKIIFWIRTALQAAEKREIKPQKKYLVMEVMNLYHISYRLAVECIALACHQLGIDNKTFEKIEVQERL